MELDITPSVLGLIFCGMECKKVVDISCSFISDKKLFVVEYHLI